METEANKMAKQPSYRFAGYTEAWEQKKLGEIVSWLKGSKLSKDRLNKDKIGYDVIHYADLYKFSDVEYDVINWTDSEDGTIIPDNSLLFPISDVTPKGLARTSTITKTGVKAGGDVLIAAVQNHLSVFLSYQINKNHKDILPLVTGTTVKHVNSKGLSTLNINLPSLHEQTTIGSFFQDIDQLISLQQRKLEVLKEQKKTYLKLLFPAKGQTKPALRFAGFEDDWKEVKLGEIADILGGNAWKSNTYSEKGRYLIITISNIKGDEYIDDSYGNRIDTNDMKFVLSKDDILISMTGNVGRVSKMTAEDAVLNQRVAKIVTTSDSEFIYTVLSDSKFENQMILSSQGSAQANISNKNILNYRLLLPTLEEQTAIGNLFRKLDSSITQNQIKLNKLKEIKQTLLKKMFI